MPYACFAHKSIRKLINLESKDKTMTIPSPHHYFEHRNQSIQLANLAVYPGKITNHHYSVLDRSLRSRDLTKPRMVQTNTGDVYLLVPYNPPIFLVRR